MATQAEVLDRYRREYLEFHEISIGRQRESQKLLTEFGGFAGKEVQNCDGGDLRAFLAFLKEEDYEGTTIAKKLSIIKPFFGWAWEAGIVDAQRLMEFNRTKPPRGCRANQLPRPYSRKELKRFRQQLDRRWPTVPEHLWKRWRKGTSRFKKVQPHLMRIQIEAIVALALHCGLRRQEIFDATIDDIHYDNAYVVVPKGKGGKFREVPHTEASREAIRAWLEIRAELGPDHDRPWLCLAWEGIELQPMRWERFASILRTIGKGWELHRFRHTYATELLRSTKRLEIVQRALGHANLQQTMVYAQLVSDDLLKAIGKAEADFQKAVGEERAA